MWSLVTEQAENPMKTDLVDRICAAAGSWSFVFFIVVVWMGFAVLAAGPVLAAEPVKIAMITAKTGEAGASNLVSFSGARFAVDEINARGGILGRPVSLLEYDNKSTPEGSAAAAQQAVKDGVVAVVGANWSSHSLAMAEVLQPAGVPMISHMSTNPVVTRVGDYIFRICFTDAFQGFGLARFAIETLGARSAVMLVNEGRAYSLGLAETFGKAFSAFGGGVLWRGRYAPGRIEYDALVHDVAQRRGDVLFIPGGYADVAGLVDRIRSRGLTIPVISADGVGPKLYSMIGDHAEGIYFSGHWSRWIDSYVSRKFVERFEADGQQVSEDAIPLAYDCFMLLADAAARAGSTEGPALRSALAETVGFEGVTGTIQFNEYGDPIKPMAISQLRFGGVYYLEQVSP
jgi:branched-chain amino acid transport system substrate-binding protein